MLICPVCSRTEKQVNMCISCDTCEKCTKLNKFDNNYRCSSCLEEHFEFIEGRYEKYDSVEERYDDIYIEGEIIDE